MAQHWSFGSFSRNNFWIEQSKNKKTYSKKHGFNYTVSYSKNGNFKVLASGPILPFRFLKLLGQVLLFYRACLWPCGKTGFVRVRVCVCVCARERERERERESESFAK